MTEIFDASVQYDDWKGTVAADNNFDETFQGILTDRGLKTDDEIVVGASLYAGENGFVSIAAYLVNVADAENAKKYLDDNPIPNVKKVTVDNLSAAEFINLFKRFNVALSWKGMDLIGRELETDE